MSSALLVFDLAERKRIAAGALAPLADALRNELSPLFGAPLPIPERKARLTRVGGRCPLDGTLLNFNPYSPTEHQCPACQRIYVGEAHHDWWAMGAQLWCAERAAQAATIHLLTDNAEAETLAVRMLTEFAVRYRTYANRDNALGPTHPFFSTYLESIWLLNICHAIALLEAAPLDDRTRRVLNEVRTTLVQPSRALIASFNEGRSNRQVWNTVAVRSASRILGDDGPRGEFTASDGVAELISHGLLNDGSWYEGENYHLFAHRGLWYGVQLMRALNRELPAELDARYSAGFVAPFLGLLPDDTFPSRRDSQYKVSIRQWRFAEWCELALAHTHDNPKLAGILHRIYDGDAPPASHRHQFSTADSERNEPPSQISRADLSWRALLMANEHASGAGHWQPQSICLPSQGLAVLRRDEGHTYVALEGGHTGGGHGHPDRLSLTLQHDNARWLEDPGTGSYVERALYWYRSTLAHFAPIFDGASQQRVPAQLIAFEERGGAGWICKRVEDVAPGVSATRTIVVADGYLIDLLEWKSDTEHQVDLPLARAAEVLSTFNWTPGDAGGAGGLEDGFDFLTDVQRTEDTYSLMQLTLPADGSPSAFYTCHAARSYWRAQAPGSPGHEPAPIHFMRTSGKNGRILGLWSWNDTVASFTLSPNEAPPGISVTTGDGTNANHSPTDDGWHIALTARHATSSIDLVKLAQPARIVDEEFDPPTFRARAPVEIPLFRSVNAGTLELAGHPISNALRFQLGESEYVRTEQNWREAGEPVATVQLAYSGNALIVDVLARTGTIVVPDAHAEPELDNERRDVNSDGLQLHIAFGEDRSVWSYGWLAVPAPETMPAARVTQLQGEGRPLKTHWVATPDGWAMRVEVPMDTRDANNSFALELLVNERTPDRQRRRGQLVLSGGGGFGYLRGDRSEPTHALTFRLPLVSRRAR